MTQPSNRTAPFSGARPEMLDLASYPMTSRLLSAAPSSDGLTLVWDDGQRAQAPALWFRDNCPCPGCRHPQTLERRYLFLDDAEPRIESTEVEPAGHLTLRFADGHEASFDGGWLRHHLLDLIDDLRPEPQLWGADHRIARFDHDRVMTSETALSEWLRAILSDGLAILENMPARDGEMLKVIGRVQQPKETNFGRSFEVMTHKKPVSSAYTAMGLEPHSDLINYASPPDFQVLACLQNDATGGGSIFVNSHAVVAALAEAAPEAYGILSETSVEFRFQDESCDIRHHAPVIELDRHGELRRLRFNNWLRGAVIAAPERMSDWYRAYARLWRLIRDPRFRVTPRLQAGEIVVFDNVRVLHGREAYDPASGSRHLQGCYTDLDWMLSRLRVAARPDG